MIVQKLVHSLNKVSPSNDQGSKALDYLVRKGLAGSILRDADAVESRLAANVADSARDAERLNWLQEELVDTIYLDDGRVIDISGRRTVREAIDAAIAASAEKGETNV
jgi:hypothetical protein